MKYGCWLLTAALLSGCSSFDFSWPGKSSPDPELLAELVQGQQYRAALDVIDQISTSSPDYQAFQSQRAGITQKARAYDARVLDKVREFQAQSKWQELYELFDEALSRLPENSETHRAYGAFQSYREEYINEQKEELNLLLAKNLLEEGQYRQRIYEADKDSRRARKDLEAYKERRDEAAEFISERGMAALEQGDYGKAKEYLKLANDLKSNEMNQKALKQVRQELDERWLKHVGERREKRQLRYTELLGEFQDAWKIRDYQKARELLAEMREIDESAPQNDVLKHQLEESIHVQIQSVIAKGQAAYSAGEVQQALDIWSEALSLAPEDEELLKHIERAKRFLGKYQSLQK
ncbi:hypothetical protein QP938_04800 [Porticoccaceae bacterium LTM1]|nr:hypothetical protein QP938_04800 [Porticoccaceae bacterium LTM1]